MGVSPVRGAQNGHHKFSEGCRGLSRPVVFKPFYSFWHAFRAGQTKLFVCTCVAAIEYPSNLRDGAFDRVLSGFGSIRREIPNLT